MSFFEHLTPTQFNALSTCLVVIGLLVLRGFGLRLVSRHVTDLPARFVWRQGINYLILLLGSISLIRLWFEWFQSILTLLSVAVAAIIIVNKELLLNMAAYPVVVWRTLFKVGDRVAISTFRGDVISVNLFYTTLAEVGSLYQTDLPSGRILKVPNALIFTNVIANYSRGLGLMWHELRLELRLKDDWEKIRTLCLKALNEVSQPITADMEASLRETGDEIMFIKSEPQVLVQVDKDKLSLVMRYICQVHKRDESEQLVWNRLLPALRQAQIIEPDASAK